MDKTLCIQHSHNIIEEYHQKNNTNEDNIIFILVDDIARVSPST
jgi:hypothetical protein